MASAGAGAAGVAATPAPPPPADPPLEPFELLALHESPRPGWYVVHHRRRGADEHIRTNVNPELLAQKLRRAPNEAQRELWTWQLQQLPT